jgi:hypothetical protein
MMRIKDRIRHLCLYAIGAVFLAMTTSMATYHIVSKANIDSKSTAIPEKKQLLREIQVFQCNMYLLSAGT